MMKRVCDGCNQTITFRMMGRGKGAFRSFDGGVTWCCPLCSLARLAAEALAQRADDRTNTLDLLRLRGKPRSGYTRGGRS